MLLIHSEMLFASLSSQKKAEFVSNVVAQTTNSSSLIRLHLRIARALSMCSTVIRTIGSRKMASRFNHRYARWIPAASCITALRRSRDRSHDANSLRAVKTSGFSCGVILASLRPTEQLRRCRSLFKFRDSRTGINLSPPGRPFNCAIPLVERPAKQPPIEWNLGVGIFVNANSDAI